MMEIKKIVDHLNHRKELRLLVKNSDFLYARVFNQDGSSLLMQIDHSLFGIDGVFGTYVDDGGRIDIIGLDSQQREMGTVRL